MLTTGCSQDMEPDVFVLTAECPQDMEPDVFESTDNPDAVERAKVEQQQVKQLQGLFKHCKFFLSREVPRECFTFLIRYCCRNP